VVVVRAENQITRDTVTEGMKEVAEAFSEVQKEHVERMQLEMENLRRTCGYNFGTSRASSSRDPGL
jgi:hypothetical protein